MNRFVRNTFTAKIFFLFRFNQLCCHLLLAYLLRESPDYFSAKPATSQKITKQESWPLGLILLLTTVLPMKNVHLTLKMKILQHLDAIISYKHFW